MAAPVAIPETVSLAVHSMARLAAAGENRLTLAELMAKPGSLDHLSKVMQKLVRAGFVRSKRGRNGGFTMAMKPSDIRLMDLWIALEGPFESNSCPLSGGSCGLSACVFGTAVEDAAEVIRTHLSGRTLDDIVPIFQEA